jgi:hypothetical protein
MMKPVFGSPPVMSAYTPGASNSALAGGGAVTGSFGCSNAESAMILFLSGTQTIVTRDTYSSDPGNIINADR